MKKTYFNWSSGKDAAMALHELKGSGYRVEKLLTTVNGHFDRVSMHGLRIDLLEAQCEAVGIPLDLVRLPEQPDMPTYEKILGDAVAELKSQGFTEAGFGDIFLEDLKIYREKKLKEAGIGCVFPLWKKDTTALIQNFIDKGFKAKIICLNSEKLDESFLGREIDSDFLKDLPRDVDSCGENGEFHTFCYDGPVFNRPVNFDEGERKYREYDLSDDKKIGYWFLDLLPK